MKTCVVGLGTIGLPVAEYIKSKSLDVVGVDVSNAAIDRAFSRGIPSSSDIPFANTYLVCVNTHCDDKPDVSAVCSVVDKIIQQNSNPFISIESTLYPGTSRLIYNRIMGEKGMLVHAPHRFWPIDPVNYGVNQSRVLGAINNDSMARGLEFYRNMLDIVMHEAEQIEHAELSKLVENVSYYYSIAFAEELKAHLGKDFEGVKKLANTKWNVSLLEPRTGIGGPCLPMNINMLNHYLNSNLLTAVQKADSDYKAWLDAQKIK